MSSVLIVDDDAAILEAFQFGFTKDGFHTLTASSANAAKDIMRENHVDAVITDIRMPEVSGEKLINWIRKEYKSPQPSILCMSGFSDLPIGEAYKQGADLFLQKPISCSDVISATQYHIQHREEMLRQKEYMVKIGRLVALGELAAGVAHEISSPLSAISSYCTLLNTILEKQPINSETRDRVIQYVKRIETTSEMITRIIRGVHSLSRDGYSESFHKAPVKDIVCNAVELSRSQIRSTNINLTLGKIDQELMIECRVSQICQILINIISNGCHAVMDVPDPWVMIQIHDLGDDIEIRIINNGSYIDGDIKDKIFKPFFTTKSNGKGVGLGLSISRKIVELHGGVIELASDTEYTCFVIRLPKTQSKMN